MNRKASSGFAASLLLVLSLACAAKAKTTTPTPTPRPSTPPSPALVAPASNASLVQPITLDWNAVSAAGGPIGSYTWQTGTTSAFTNIIASGFTNMESDASIPTRTEDKVSGLPNGTYFWRVKATQLTGGATGSVDSAWSAVRTFTVPGLGPAPATPSFTTPANNSQFHLVESFKIQSSAVPGAHYYVLEADGRKSIPAQWTLGRDGYPSSLWTFRPEPSHLRRVGRRSLLERLRGNHEMHGEGTFYDPRLKRSQFPLAVSERLYDVRHTPDLVTSKLSALHFYQLSLPAPKPPANSYDHALARRGKAIFEGPAKCATCHAPPLFSEPGWAMHSGAEIGMDNWQADRSPDHRYRTTPLAGLFVREKGGYYHDGRFATLRDVVNPYEKPLHLRLTEADKTALVEYLKSL